MPWSACFGGSFGSRGLSSITSIGQELFRDIRKAFGVSDEAFLASLGIRQVVWIEGLGFRVQGFCELGNQTGSCRDSNGL